MRNRLALASAITLAHSSAAITSPLVRSDDERRIGVCIHASARGHIWLERTLWALRDTEGGWIDAAILNSNGSYDLGPMQVNSWWIPKLANMLGRQDGQVASWLRSNPCFNVEVSRWIFLSSLAQARDFWTAVGLYHSRNLQLRAAYARNVWTRYRRRLTEDMKVATSAMPASTRVRAAGND
jgi:hypothetical protein